MKRFFGMCVIGVAAFGLVACAGAQTQKLNSFEPQGSQFDVALSDGYRNLAFGEFNEGDYRGADAFAGRAVSAGSGNPPAPTEVGSSQPMISTRGQGSVPADSAGELSDARARLVSALNNGAGSIAPADAAEAQVNFDCWIHEQSENWPFQQDQVDTCRENFYAAIGRVETAMAPDAPVPAAPSDYLVFFDFDSAMLTPEAQAIVNEAAANAKSANANRIIVTGHTDTSGPAEYNMGLSLRRAESVRDELVLSGIPEANIELVARGQTQPLVPTPDGVREPQNRRVEIQFGTAGATNGGVTIALVK